MYDRISQMEPLLPRETAKLQDLAREVLGRSAALGGQLHPVTQATVVEFLRIINSYYSNLIEGHSTHPIDIDKAMRQQYSDDPATRGLQEESLAHIQVQRQIEARLGQEPDLNVADAGFLQWLHEQFYRGLPKEMLDLPVPDSSETCQVMPGALRLRDVQVGRHVAPIASSLPAFLKRFGEFYRSGAHHGLTPILAAASAHHRLMWIHPFLDGNGRVARLYTDACLLRLPLPGYGLWNLSRGLARGRDKYMAALTLADAPRRNDLDGRGALSAEGLEAFCQFFLETCLDQIDYMGGSLRLDSLLERLRGYVELRKSKNIPPPHPGHPGLRSQAAIMLQEALLRGEIPRGEIVGLSGLGERTGRSLLAQLLDEGLLGSHTAKGPVRLMLSPHLAEYLFPGLYPRQWG